ncbi:MAG: YggT family protein [SAR324 cluster bacterium]|nr:YggT family protein [SAR324 cluster bacterium]
MNGVPIALIQVLSAVLDIYTFILVARALISWVSPDPRNQIVQLLHRLTEPVLAPVRRTIPPIGGMDLSVLVVLVAIQLIRSTLLRF